VIGFRHTDPRFPFLWEDDTQPPGRWHGPGEGPVHYFADTPDGAWAEFLRHEEIIDPADVAEVRRAVWAVELGPAPRREPSLSRRTLTGGRDSYPACQREARRLRDGGARGLVAPAAALRAGAAHGWRVDGGLRRGDPRDGRVIALFGPRPDLVGWEAVHEGRPSTRLLGRVRQFPGVAAG
jgi:hypothetical protein